MYGCSSIRAPSHHSGNRRRRFQGLSKQLLNHRYRILQHLGQRGFSQTFLAIDEQDSLPCVIKQVFLQHDQTHHQTALERLHQAAKQLAALGEHPQIPALLNAFEQDGNTFIVQEWIDGWTLEQEADGVPFDEAEVRQVLQAVLPIVQYLHDRNIIHRDIKPANIIRRKSDRQLVLVDFGAAKQITHLNSCNLEAMVGSVQYAAPEQINGQAIFASDLYSLGMTCLYLLTQLSPFDLYDMIENDWKWQAYLPQPISPALKALLCKLLQPALRQRYQSAAAVLSDLQAAIAHMSASATPLSADVAHALTPQALASFVQKVPSVSGATIYFPPTQAWYCLPCREKASDSKTQAAFFLSLRVAAVADTPPVQKASCFAEEIAALKALPLAWRVLLVSIGTIVGSVAMACLVFCLGVILFALSTPLNPGATPLKGDRSSRTSL